MFDLNNCFKCKYMITFTSYPAPLCGACKPDNILICDIDYLFGKCPLNKDI